MKCRDSLNTDKESILKSARLENGSHPTMRRMEGRKRGYSGSLEAFYRIKNVGQSHRLSHSSQDGGVLRVLVGLGPSDIPSSVLFSDACHS